MTWRALSSSPYIQDLLAAYAPEDSPSTSGRLPSGGTVEGAAGGGAGAGAGAGAAAWAQGGSFDMEMEMEMSRESSRDKSSVSEDIGERGAGGEGGEGANGGVGGEGGEGSGGEGGGGEGDAYGRRSEEGWQYFGRGGAEESTSSVQFGHMPGRGSHSSTSQLNLSRVCQENTLHTLNTP